MRLIIFILFFLVLFTPFSWALSLSSAQEDYMRGDYESALRKARSLEESDETLYFLGLVNVKTADYPQARKYFRQLTKLFPNSYLCPQGMLKLADTYFLQKDYVSAEQLYRTIIEKYPSLDNMPLVLLRLGQIASRRGDWEVKKKYLDLIKSKYPQCSEMRYVAILEGYGDFFTIQIGAFSNKANAVALVDKLRDNYNAYVVSDTGGSYSVHKVRIGHFKKRYDVEKAALELRDQGYPVCIYP